MNSLLLDQASETRPTIRSPPSMQVPPRELDTRDLSQSDVVRSGFE
jgi:hypothetical protein